MWEASQAVCPEGCLHVLLALLYFIALGAEQLTPALPKGASLMQRIIKVALDGNNSCPTGKHTSKGVKAGTPQTKKLTKSRPFIPSQRHVPVWGFVTGFLRKLEICSKSSGAFWELLPACQGLWCSCTGAHGCQASSAALQAGRTCFVRWFLREGLESRQNSTPILYYLGARYGKGLSWQ